MVDPGRILFPPPGPASSHFEPWPVAPQPSVAEPLDFPRLHHVGIYALAFSVKPAARFIANTDRALQKKDTNMRLRDPYPSMAPNSR
jgi:hypothetical protein